MQLVEQQSITAKTRTFQPRLIFAYSKNPSCAHGRHSGIGISCLNTSKTLSQHGYNSEVWPIAGGDDLWAQLYRDRQSGRDPITHVVIGALFIPTDYVARLAFNYPDTKFVINSHSNVGFLQSEPAAITKFRETIDLQTESRNVFAGGNSARFVRSMQVAYGHCLLLPNLYYLSGNESSAASHWKSGSHLRVGCFGASRVQKNFSTAIVAAICAANQLQVPIEIWINTGRDDSNGNVVYRAAKAWTEGTPNVTLKELPWAEWAKFRTQLKALHMLVQPSYSETFSQVAADACAAGIPTIAGPAIEWLPYSWQADPDDALSIAEKMRQVLHDPFAAQIGMQALRDRNEASLPFWRGFLA